MRQQARKKVNNNNNSTKKATAAYEASRQAQKQRQTQVTGTQSLTLVKNLIRVSISTVCHMRGIFPQGCFQNRTYAGMNIYQLDSATRDAETGEMFVKDQEAYDFTLWLESGVFEAVENRYLRRMEFIIASPAHGNRPRESYAFDLTYLEDSEDAVVLFNGTEVTTVENSKVQLVQLIRSLIALGSTLGELPRERVLNIKLWYYDERTPPGWQPNHFREADPSELKFKNADKLKIKIGDLKTPHHTLSLVFTGYDNQEHAEQPDQALPLPVKKSQQGQEGRRQDRPIGKTCANDNSSSASGDSRDGLQEVGMSDDDEHEEDEDVEARQDGGWAESGGLLTCKVGPAVGENEDGRDDDGDDSGTDRDENMDEHYMDEQDTDEETQIPDAVTTRAVSKLASGMRNSLTIGADERDPDQDKTTKNISNDGRRMESIIGQEVRPVETTSEYEVAKAWVVTQARPTQTGLVNNLDTTREQARDFLDRMVREGILVKKNFRYQRVEHPKGSRRVQAESSMSDDSATQVPPEAVSTNVSKHQPRDRHDTRSSPSTMSMPPPPSQRHRDGRRGEGNTPETRCGTSSSGRDGCARGKDFDTPPVPTSLARSNPQPVPEKPQRAMMMTMGTKRVLDESALSDRGDGCGNGVHRDDDSDSVIGGKGSRMSKNLNDLSVSQMRGRDAEPIDVFNPSPSELDSQPGYERLLLSQDSTASTAGKPKRKCSLAINPIHQSVPSKRLRVDQRRQGRE
ncbi:unnamed protein product [Scytosiphon promiscuus]